MRLFLVIFHNEAVGGLIFDFLEHPLLFWSVYSKKSLFLVSTDQMHSLNEKKTVVHLDKPRYI